MKSESESPGKVVAADPSASGAQPVAGGARHLAAVSTSKKDGKSTGLTRVGDMYQVACIPAIQTAESFSKAVSCSRWLNL